MAEDDIASRMIEALQDAPSMQLYQMRALIDVLLDDPKREAAARMRLHLGQAVQFIDHRTGEVRHGKLIARNDKQATVLEEKVRRTWKIPYVAIDSLCAERGVQAYEPPPEPATRMSSVAFKVGDKVTFDDVKGVAQTGMVTRINRRTATLQTLDGRNWRVGFELLRHVLDV